MSDTKIYTTDNKEWKSFDLTDRSAKLKKVVDIKNSPYLLALLDSGILILTDGEKLISEFTDLALQDCFDIEISAITKDEDGNLNLRVLCVSARQVK